jgi:fructosamine-3-kinase
VSLPAAVRSEVEDALRKHTGDRSDIASVTRVGGGCISPSTCIASAKGERWFLKWSAGRSPSDFFHQEARSLRALRGTGVIRVPEVVAASDSWLLLEWLEPGRGTGNSWAKLGRDLAALHGVAAEMFGWECDNYIGSLPQENQQRADWPVFWRDARIVPQLERALAAGHLSSAEGKRFDSFLDSVADVLAVGNEEGAALLHGDLWNGNVHMMVSGEAALVDPSTYYGHREVDLAMAELFGGFGQAFFEAYDEALPLLAGYREQRRSAYQLYYLLVHVNLFGRGYVDGALRVVRDYR